jgi:hypothetical protein
MPSIAGRVLILMHAGALDVQVEELKALVSGDSQEPINARHRRTLRRCAAVVCRSAFKQRIQACKARASRLATYPL